MTTIRLLTGETLETTFSRKVGEMLQAQIDRGDAGAALVARANARQASARVQR